MTHDSVYVNSLPSEEQLKQDFVCVEGYATHISLIRLLRSGLTVAQVQRYIEDNVREHYVMKSKFLALWDKVNTRMYSVHVHVLLHQREGTVLASSCKLLASKNSLLNPVITPCVESEK